MQNLHSSRSPRPPHRPSPRNALLTTAVLAALAASASAQLQFEELPRKGLPPHHGWAVALGDVDGDGDLDLVVGNGPTCCPSSPGQNRLYLNDGNGTFTDVTATRMPAGGANAAALGDVDGDGDGDLDMVSAYAYGSTTQKRLYLNDGIGTFTDVTATQMPASASRTNALVLGDVDGDGDLDMVCGNHRYDGFGYHPEQDQLFLNDGTGVFTDATATRMPFDLDMTHAVVLGDIDGDGDLDLVKGDGHGYLGDKLYRNDGAGNFTDVSSTQMPGSAGTVSVALGDVDGDGDLDMVLGRWRHGQDCLFLNDGMGTFSDATAARMPVSNFSTTAVALGDVEGDGDLDLVIAGEAQLYLNDGTGSFADVTATRMPVDSSLSPTLALGDVDGDDDLDLVVRGRLYSNLQRQLHAPVDLQIGQTYTLDAWLRYVPPSPITFALPYVSFAPASIALPPFGTLGIDPSQAVALPLIHIPQPAGTGSLHIPIANDPGLLGTRIYSQALLVPYPHQARLSNVVTDVLQ